MRKLLVAGMLLGAVQGAQAADLPILRGALPDTYGPRVVNWEGFYIGGQAGYGSFNTKFRPASNDSLVNALIDNIPPNAGYGIPSSIYGQLGNGHSQEAGYGAFAGYNSQWDDVVLGIEGSYIHGSFTGASSWVSYPQPAGSADVFSRASMTVKDYATVRGRAGYVVGAFMPYAFGGVALGNADVYRAVGVIATNSADPVPPAQVSQINNRFVYGYAGGLGVDINLMAGLFLRAEWEYLRFTAPVDVSINTVRAGLGYKF